MVGATRSRTLVFLQEREKKHQMNQIEVNSNHRPLLNDQPATDDGPHSLSFPPEWMNTVNDIEELLSSIRKRIQELRKAQDELPKFGFGGDNNSQVEIITDEITRLFNRTKDGIQRITTFNVKPQEESVKKNLANKLALQVQDLSTEFRKIQKNYLLKMKGRSTHTKNLFTIEEETDDAHFDVSFSSEQRQRMESQEKIITQREQEMIHLAKSISELYQIFKDMATLVEEQGTLLDRIDYNIETASHSLEVANENFRDTIEYQKKLSQ